MHGKYPKQLGSIAGSVMSQPIAGRHASTHASLAHGHVAARSAGAGGTVASGAGHEYAPAPPQKPLEEKSLTQLAHASAAQVPEVRSPVHASTRGCRAR